MKNAILLFVGLLLASTTVNAMSFEEALEIGKLSNEQVVSRIPEDYAAAEVVDELQNGLTVEPERMLLAEAYCVEALAKVGTKSLRKNLLQEMMSGVDLDLEARAFKGGSADRYYGARQLSSALRRRFNSLMEFQAARYSNFLLIIQAHK